MVTVASAQPGDSWISTYSGARFYLGRHNVVIVGDIAHGLSHQCRFGGQGPFYSVAQHSWLVADVVFLLGGDLEQQLVGILHDASEALIGDLQQPIKHQPYLEGYRKLERDVQEQIMDSLAPGLRDTPLVKRADELVFQAEVFDLMARQRVRCFPYVTKRPKCVPAIAPLSATRAKYEWLRRYDELRAKIRRG